MSVKAKVFVSSVKRQASTPDAIEVTFAACQGKGNEAWSEASPSIQMSMTINNPGAAVQFRLNEEFYLTFDPAGPVTTLAECPEFVVPDYYLSASQGYFTPAEDGKVQVQLKALPKHVRCDRCNCREDSHYGDLRKQVLAWRP